MFWAVGVNGFLMTRTKETTYWKNIMHESIILDESEVFTYVWVSISSIFSQNLFFLACHLMSDS